ncbi:MAG: hypothetical protein R3F43_24855 [bacterium]
MPSPPPGSVALEVAGEVLWLLPERALYWPAAGVLAVADLHWGKAETFQQHGVPVSSRLRATTRPADAAWPAPRRARPSSSAT